MHENKTTAGHLTALITILFWSTTFVSTKILLRAFSPIEILIFRFIIGYITLILVFPHHIKTLNKKQELHFVAAGLCGVTLYFLLENISLTYTLVSNVGVIISIAPFFTAVFSHLFLESEKMKKQFFIGFVVAIAGIILIAFNGKFVLKLNPLGDILAALAAIVWAIYSVIMKKITEFHYNTIGCTRRVFFYGLLFMIPSIFLFNFRLGLERFTSMTNLFNILFLGLGASALCFVTWNWAVKILGAFKTSLYIYIGPAITVLSSCILLKEKLTWIAVLGTILTLAGLFISNWKGNFKIEEKNIN